MSILWKSKVDLEAEIQTAEEEKQKRLEKTEAMEKLATMQAVSIASTLPVEKLMEIKSLFPEWKDLIGKAITKADYPYILDDGILYNLQQDTLVQEHYKPSMSGMLAIYAPVIKDPSVEGPQSWKQPVPPQSYSKGDQVTHIGFVWESGVDNNVWEPGVGGVYDNIWKKIREV